MQTTNPKQAHVMQVRQMCTCVCMGAGVKTLLIENNTVILSSNAMFFTCSLQAVLTLLTFQAYKPVLLSEDKNLKWHHILSSETFLSFTQE